MSRKRSVLARAEAYGALTDNVIVQGATYRLPDDPGRVYRTWGKIKPPGLDLESPWLWYLQEPGTNGGLLVSESGALVAGGWARRDKSDWYQRQSRFTVADLERVEVKTVDLNEGWEI